MADILPSQSVSIQKLMDNIDAVKYNPSNIQRIILEHLDEVTNSEVNIVDPTNPFVFLLEASCINTAVAINENQINLRKQYPSLAQNEEELYLHLSDKDFIDRFSKPSETEFTFMLKVSDVLNKLIFDNLENCYKAIIPRDTEFNIENYTFTLQYPIVIRRYTNGVVKINYDITIESPLQTLSTNIIDYSVRKDTNSEDWIFFKLNVLQIKIVSETEILQQSSLFNKTYNYTDKYYYTRVYYKNTSTSDEWKEIRVTYTDEVYDPFIPTAVVKVFEGYINLFIPPIYLTNGSLSGDIRVDIFSTQGKINIDLSNYKIASFSTNIRALDEIRDINEYTNVLADINYFSFSDQRVNSGSNGIDFETLRDRVINNTVGPKLIPITNVELASYVQDYGYEIIKNIDTVTNRLFLASKNLPDPLNSKLNTPATAGIASFITSLEYLQGLTTVKHNGNRTILFSNNIFIKENGILSIVQESDIIALQQSDYNTILNTVNSKQYLYNPFYYIFDISNNIFEVRAYNLDYPVASNLSFISQNQTLQCPVNTSEYNLVKTTYGYKLTIITKSGNYYKQLLDNQVDCQLAFYTADNNKLAFIQSTYIGLTSDNERIYEFQIQTDYDIDGNDNITIKNAKIDNNNVIDTIVNLSSQFHLFYTTNSLTSSFVPDEADNLIGKFMLATDSTAITHETIEFKFGSNLKKLWTRARSLASGLIYDTYTADIPAFYTEDVYEIDPLTGSMFTISGGNVNYNILHHVGEPILDINGDQVYLHRIGDIKLDANGNPIIVSPLTVDHDMDLFLVDAKYYFATDKSFIDYKEELVDTLSQWIVNDIPEIEKVLLERSSIYFYPKTTYTQVSVTQDNNTIEYVDPEQSFNIDLYVTSKLFNNEDLKTSTINNCVIMLNNYLAKTEINMTEFTIELKSLLGENVKSIDINGLGGTKNYKIVKVVSENSKMYLKKRLKRLENNLFIVEEDVTINFFNVEKNII